MLNFITDLFYSTLRVSTPLIFAALGGLLCERAGVINIALEGHMLVGAFTGMYVSFVSGSPWLGALVGGVSGVALAYIMGYMCVSLKSNQIVVGTAINIVAVGLTSFLLKMFNVNSGSEIVVSVPSFSEVNVPGLSEIPYLGKMLFSYKPLTYVSFLVAALVGIYLMKTKIGLVHRAVGENPQAADTLGISVKKVRFLAILACGFLCGVAGAYLSTSQLNQFQDEMVSGKGFIAYAAIIFGKWSPRGVVLAALAFGAADALQMRIQATDLNISYHLLQMLPYVLTMIALAGVIGKSEGPAASGIPYVKEEG